MLRSQIACPAADADVHAELYRLAHGFHEVVGVRIVANDEMNLLHAPSGQPREDRTQLLGIGQRNVSRLRRRGRFLGKAETLEECMEARRASEECVLPAIHGYSSLARRASMRVAADFPAAPYTTAAPSVALQTYTAGWLPVLA